MTQKLNYEVIGQGGQEFIQITLEPNDKFIAETGAMIYMDNGVNFEAKMGDGSNPKAGFMSSLLDVGKRVLAGEGLAMAHFTNESGKKQVVGLSGPYPGAIVGLDLADLGGVFYAQRGAYLASSYGTEITVATTGSISSTFLGGEGLFMQKLIGQGTLVLHAGGTIHQRDLAPGEVLLVDEGCIVGYTDNIDFEVQMASNSIGTLVFGGEGLCLSKLTGRGQGGTVLLQNLPISRFGKALSPYITTNNNS